MEITQALIMAGTPAAISAQPRVVAARPAPSKHDSSHHQERLGKSAGMWPPAKRRRGIGVAIHTCSRASMRCCHAFLHLRATMTAPWREEHGWAGEPAGPSMLYPTVESCHHCPATTAGRALIFPADLSGGWFRVICGGCQERRQAPRRRHSPLQVGPRISVAVVARSQPRTTEACSPGIHSSSQSRGSAAKKGIAPRSPPDRDLPAAQWLISNLEVSNPR